MIFNNKEVVNVLKKCLFSKNLTNEDVTTIRTLICYFRLQEPKITFDEFKKLFQVKKNLIDIDTVELIVIPKNRFYVRIADDRLINDIMDVNSEIQEHLQAIAYSEFKKVLDNLKEN